VKQCRCSPLQREAYVGKISGPLVDRIAIHGTGQPGDVSSWSDAGRGDRTTSEAMRQRGMQAREMQAARFADIDGADCNARLPEGLFKKLCTMQPAAEALFIRAQKSLLVSARARGHIIRVARTIADLEGKEKITERHLGEAVGYRGSPP
jgi:magnesium chelatase family protein